MFYGVVPKLIQGRNIREVGGEVIFFLFPDTRVQSSEREARAGNLEAGWG